MIPGNVARFETGFFGGGMIKRRGRFEGGEREETKEIKRARERGGEGGREKSKMKTMNLKF
jgi:hypothetical protein